MSSTKVLVSFETNLGDFTVEMFSEKSPITVKNFLRYVSEGFYDNTIFHRVIDGFMVQGGGFSAGMKQKKTHEPIINEAKNKVSNVRGTLAMARTSDPNSATAQFFINVVDNTFLDNKGSLPDVMGYCVFGAVTKGMDVVDKIKSVKTGFQAGHQDVPVEDVVVISVKLA